MNTDDAYEFLKKLNNLIDEPISWSDKNTFKEEFEWLNKNLPEALHKSSIPEDCFSKCPSIEQAIAAYRRFLAHSHFEHDLYILRCNNNEISDVDKLITEIAEKYINLNNEDARYEDIPQKNQFDAEVSNRGCEFLGMYVSMHSHFNDKEYPWGIYLFPEAIRWSAYNLYNDVNLPLASINEYIKLMVCAVFRHEVFHYQVERYSTIQEISQRRNLYVPYKKTVYCHYYLTKECLEEALAEAAVHKSKSIKNYLKSTSFSSQQINQILTKHSNQLPPGYRDYDCTTYTDENNAHRILAAQICNTTPSFDIQLTNIATIKSTQFFTTGIEVPLYIVTMDSLNPSDLKRAIRVAKVREQI